MKTRAQEAGCSTGYFLGNWELLFMYFFIDWDWGSSLGICLRGKQLRMSHITSHVLEARVLWDFVRWNPLSVVYWRFICVQTRSLVSTGRSRKVCIVSSNCNINPTTSRAQLCLETAVEWGWLPSDHQVASCRQSEGHPRHRNHWLPPCLKGETRGPLQAQKESVIYLLRGKWSIGSPLTKTSPHFLSRQNAHNIKVTILPILM